jgi:branched-chain amino acid transport system ATP-binding protein
MGVLPTLSGTLSLAAEDITSLPAYHRARRGLGYVPQGRMIFADLTVQENLLVGADLDPERGRGRIEAVLQRFPKLAGRLRQPGGTLSGGEQQMLALGRALVGGPKMLLLDEPTAGVQPSVVAEIVEQLRAIGAEGGLPMILVEHNVEMVAALCSRIYVMDKGIIVAEIAPEQVHDEAIVRAYLAI